MKTMKVAISTAVVALLAISAQADVLYNLASFNNNGSVSNVQWIVGITTITSIEGVTGTDESELLSLQTLVGDPTTATRTGTRFCNTETSSAPLGTMATGPDGDKYFQFGIDADSGKTINLTSLTFQAMRATGTGSTRGYNIDVSVNDGAYIDLGAENIANNRNNGLAGYTLGLTDTEVTSVDFRVYSTGGNIEYTNFAVNGTVIPEPATLGLIAVFGGGVLFIRRRFMI